MKTETTIQMNSSEKPDPSAVTKTELSSSPTISITQAQNVKNMLKDTTIVTEDKVQFNEDEIKVMIPLETQYEIVESFAEGGLGIISRGKDKILQRYVAIKSLKSSYLNNQQAVSNFITEAKITAQLDHPSIIPLYSIHNNGQDDGIHISMKLIHGHTMKELIEDTILLCKQYRTTKLKSIVREVLKERLEDFQKVCDAISFAHSKNVIHRDLKPDNIMVGSFHEVYVMDWGIAMVNDDNEEVSEEVAEKISGTPGYISPEVVVGGKPTFACDQYALGMILFELITLNPGITGSTMGELFRKTRDGELEPIKHRFPECRVPEDLIAVVRKATALDPKDRYSRVEDMAEDIRRYLMNAELAARPDNLPRKIYRWIFNHKNAAAAFLMVFLLSCAGAVIYSLVKKNEAEKESKHKALKLVALHSAIENNAHFIDRHFFHIAHILNRFASDALIAMRIPEVPEKEHLEDCFPASAFNKKPFPHGTVFSPAYKRNISLDVMNYSAPQALSVQQRNSELKRLSLLQNRMFRYLLNSDSDNLIKGNLEVGRKKAVEKGFPIRWIYVALKDGLTLKYPASGGLNSYDPRNRAWYQNAFGNKNQAWSRPYIDQFGLGLVITASQAIYDGKGKFYGVASLDMTFDYVTQTLMRKGMDNPAIIARYLINSGGDVILSSRIDNTQINNAKKHSTEIEFKPFPYPEIKKYIKMKNAGQFETQRNGHTMLIGYAPVTTLNWFYVEEIDLEHYLKN